MVGCGPRLKTLWMRRFLDLAIGRQQGMEIFDFTKICHIFPKSLLST